MARSGKFGFNDLQQECYPNELRPAIIRILDTAPKTE
jgi:hypothetical protein